MKSSITDNNGIVWYCTSISEKAGDRYDFSRDHQLAIDLSKYQTKRFRNYQEYCGYKVNEFA